MSAKILTAFVGILCFVQVVRCESPLKSIIEYRQIVSELSKNAIEAAGSIEASVSSAISEIPSLHGQFWEIFNFYLYELLKQENGAKNQTLCQLALLSDLHEFDGVFDQHMNNVCFPKKIYERVIGSIQNFTSLASSAKNILYKCPLLPVEQLRKCLEEGVVSAQKELDEKTLSVRKDVLLAREKYLECFRKNFLFLEIRGEIVIKRYENCTKKA